MSMDDVPLLFAGCLAVLEIRNHTRSLLPLSRFSPGRRSGQDSLLALNDLSEQVGNDADTFCTPANAELLGRARQAAMGNGKEIADVTPIHFSTFRRP